MSEEKMQSKLNEPLWVDGSLLVGNTLSVSKITLPLNVQWKPQADITAYELARLLPLFLCGSITPNMLPTDDELLRHLVVRDPNKP